MRSNKDTRLGKSLRKRRVALGLSARAVERATGIDSGTIVRIENGWITSPAPGKLSRIADALGLNLADVFALADYPAPNELPSFPGYLRTKYSGLPTSAVKELEETFERIAEAHGLHPDGPAKGEDEQPEIQIDTSEIENIK